MNILVIGNGGREHALVWKIAQSKRVSGIFCANGNPGTAEFAENVPIRPDDMAAVLDFIRIRRIDLTVVGPERPLVLGLVDVLEAAGCAVFGPTRDAARLEGSKVFSKQLMKKYGIPTAGFEVFDNATAAREYILRRNTPCVVKADGLAAGKGAIVCPTVDEALAAVQLIMGDKNFGNAGDQVVVEDMMTGEEASLFAITDGRDYVMLPAAQDHKRAGDGDTGKNTGGMGAYAPAPVMTGPLLDEARRTIIEPTIAAMINEGHPYRGVLYGGLMLTPDGPKVVEFNCRFGDPECQALMPLIGSDIVDLFMAVAERNLKNYRLEILPRSAACVVMASGGYPDAFQKGKTIRGLETARASGALVFHAGTAMNEGSLVTAGGRVLGITASADRLEDALALAYRGVSAIDFDEKYFRTDIGHRALHARASR